MKPSQDPKKTSRIRKKMQKKIGKHIMRIIRKWKKENKDETNKG